MKKLLCALGIMASVLASYGQSTFTANLTGSAAGTSSSATGTGTFTLNGSTFSYDITYTGLTGNPTAAHVHISPGGGVVHGIIANGALGTSGRYTGTATYTAGQISDLMAGNFYVNIHSVAFGGGEIRGDILVVPEPGTLALGGLGIAALAFASRRKK